MNYGIWIIGLIFTISFTPKCQSCHNFKSADGLSVANCTNLNYHETPKLPDDVQVADFTRNPNLELRRFFLMDYSSTLLRLIMRENLYASRHILGSKGLTLDMFSKLSNLEEFDFSDSELTNEHQWVLPSGLKKYTVNGNYYSFLDVSRCAELEELSVNNNFLDDMPKLHRVPSPPLRIFRARKNPLDKLTVLTLAPLCYLVELELEFPSHAYLAGAKGSCDCSLIKYFANEMEIRGIENLKCFNETAAYKASCSNDTLYQAKKIRKNCPLLTKGSLPSTIKTILKMVFFLTLLFLILATLILYIIRHYHLREWWRAHHNPPPTPRTEEEEEEQSILTGSSISDGSVATELTPT